MHWYQQHVIFIALPTCFKASMDHP